VTPWASENELESNRITVNYVFSLEAGEKLDKNELELSKIFNLIEEMFIIFFSDMNSG
jgi:hypothetical protein